MNSSALPVILHPHPLRLEVRQHIAAPGQTIAEILSCIPDLPPEIWTHGAVRIGEMEIAREHWHRVRPKPGSRHLMHVGIRLHGGGGGGKNIFATIAAIALIVAATAITGGILGPGGALSISSTYFAAGSTSAALLAAGVSIIGALALSALAPAPAVEQAADDNGPELGSASIRGNVLSPFDPIPFVTGTHRIAPPHLIPPWSESVNDDQFVYAIVGLNGAHDFDDIRINGAPIDEFADVEYEIRDVVNDDSDLTLIDRQVFENQIGAELQGHKVNDDATDELQDDVTPANSYPKFQVARSRNAPDEIWLTLAWNALVNQEDAGGTSAAGIPVRVRIRRVGDVNWINLPEFHVQRERLEPFRGIIKLLFSAPPDTFTRIDQAPAFPPWRYAFDIDDTDNDEDFAVDSYFAAVSGNNADNVASEDGNVLVYLDPATFPPDFYDIQIKRGYGYRVTDFSPSTYKISSAIPYFFSHVPASSPPSIRKEQSKVPGKMSWQSLSSVWNDYPLGEKGMSLIAVKAKNLSISNLTTLASGYANVWNGADWDDFAPTANPAAWFRYLALGGQSIRAPFVAAQLDDDSLADWHDFCDASGAYTGEPVRECNAFLEGRNSLDETLRIVGGCGRAAVRLSDKVGVVIDRDRSAENPIQLFSQRNSKGLAIRRAFPRIPDGLRVRFNDETNDYAPREIFVYRKRLPTTPTDIEAVTYVGITAEALALDRANLDLAQLTRRASLYNFETDIENLYLTKGSLVYLAHDTLSRHFDAARVVSVATSGGNVTGLTTDVALRLSLAADSDDFADDAAASPPDGWASQWDANTTANVTAVAALPEGQGPELAKTTGNGDAFWAWENGGEGTDIEVLALIRPLADSGDTSNAFGVVLRGVGNNSTKTGYRAVLNSSAGGARDKIEISKWVAGSFTFLANADFDWFTGVNYWLRFRASGTALKARIWRTDEAEPASWTVTTTDSDVAGPGLAGLYIFNPATSFAAGSFALAAPNGVVLQLKDGSTLTKQIEETADTTTISFTTPFAEPADDALEADCLVACGPFSSVQKRMLVLGVQPQNDLTAALTLVDEAGPVQLFSADGSALSTASGAALFAPF